MPSRLLVALIAVLLAACGSDSSTTTAAATTTAACIDHATFVEETVPDDTAFAPGAAFEKSWTIENTGTCTWTTGYAVWNSGGDRLGDESAVAFSHEVLPGESIDLVVAMTAPGEPGTYRSDWMLRNAAGVPFGLGDDDTSFWAAIGVQPPAADVLVFDSNDDGDKEIYTKDLTTGEITQLTDNPAYDGMPAWSPDGEQIVFISDRDGNYEVYAMDADGANPIRLTSNMSKEMKPSWSPDGAWLAFESDAPGNSDIYRYELASGGISRCTTDAAADVEVHFAPDGSHLIFSSYRDGDWELFTTTCSTPGEETRLTENAFADGYGTYSPDGSRIAFHSDRTGDWLIHIMDADGSEAVAAGNGDAGGWAPQWSPDGARIAYHPASDICILTLASGEQECFPHNTANEEYPSFRPVAGATATTPVVAALSGVIVFDSNVDGDKEIYTMDLATRVVTRLTDNPAFDGMPAWSAAGSYVIFSSDRDGDFEVFWMNADGSEQTQMSDNTAYEGRPSWSPDGNRIAWETDRQGSRDIKVFWDLEGDEGSRYCVTDAASDGEPHWAADSSYLIFTSDRDGDPELFRTDCSGSAAEVQITNNNVVDGFGSISPDGTRIVFHRWENDKGTLHIMNLDGSHEVPLAIGAQQGAAPSWSPDGSQVIFLGRDSTQWDICILTMSTSMTTCVTDDEANQEFPSFRP